jgi:AraC-like DNA-binding protein
MELIFHFGAGMDRPEADGSITRQPTSVVAGQISRFLELRPRGRIGMVAARFQSVGAAAFLRLPLGALTHRIVDLREISRGGPEIEPAEDHIRKARDVEERFRRLERFLIARLAWLPPQSDRLRPVTAAVSLIQQAAGQIEAESLSKEMAMSRRVLERRFQEAIGLSPKRFARIVRLQRTIRRYGEGGVRSLTDLGLEAGYYDQAHFIRDFRELVGMSPRAYFGGPPGITALFTE